jgi:primosomal protein N''
MPEPDPAPESSSQSEEKAGDSSEGATESSSRQTRLQKRLLSHIRSFVDFYYPELKGEVTELDHLEGNQTLTENLYTLGHIEKDWEQLRKRVAPSAITEEEPNPSEVEIDGLKYLEKIRDVMGRRLEELESKRRQQFEHRNHWADDSDLDDPNSASREKREEVLQAIERRLEDIEEKISFARYRRSMAKAMLTQVTLTDKVLPWRVYSQATGGTISPQRLDELGKSERRTALIGRALDYFYEGEERLPVIDKKKDFREWAAKVVRTSGLSEGESTPKAGVVSHWLKKTGCWETSETSREGEYLRDIMKQCINYARRNPLSLSEKKERSLKKAALDLKSSVED